MNNSKGEIVKIILVILSLHSTVKCECQSAFLSNDSLESQVTLEFNKLAIVCPMLRMKVGKLFFFDDPDSLTSSQNFDIKVNKAELAKYIGACDSDVKSILIKFILAHEIGHNFENQRIYASQIRGAIGERRIYLECLSDLFAGFLISVVQTAVEYPTRFAKNPALQGDTSDENKGSRAIFLALKRIIEVDGINVDADTHPENYERYAAVYQGFTIGNVYGNYILYKKADSAHLIKSKEKQNLVNEYYSKFGDPLNFNPFDSVNKIRSSPILWLTREASQIMHINNFIVKNLTVFEPRIKWEKDGSKRFVDFSFQVKNNNNDWVDFWGNILSEAVPDTGSAEYREETGVVFIDNFPFDVFIPPYKSVTIHGKVKCDFSLPFYDLSLVLPNRLGALYCALSMSGKSHDMSDVPFYSYDCWNWDLGKASDLIFGIWNEKDDMSKYIKGIGYCSDDALNDTSKVLFETYFNSGVSWNAKILVDSLNRSTCFIFPAYFSNDSAVTLDHFDDLQRKIHGVLKDLTNEPTIDESSIIGSGFFDRGQLVINIGFYVRPVQNRREFSIFVSVYSKKVF